MKTITLPKRARDLISVADQHNWEVDVCEDELPIDGATESCVLGFILEFASGRSFAFTAALAKSASTNRWQFRRDDDGYPVMGALFPGDGSASDQWTSLCGRVVAERRWKKISNLEWWLARPTDVASLDWVKDEL